MGTYASKVGWPSIEIKKVETGFELQWGILSGPIYLDPVSEEPYWVQMKARNRHFKIEGNTLTSGSIVLEKVK